LQLKGAAGQQVSHGSLHLASEPQLHRPDLLGKAPDDLGYLGLTPVIRGPEVVGQLRYSLLENRKLARLLYLLYYSRQPQRKGGVVGVYKYRVVLYHRLREKDP
jgi:hypothetical protein